MNDLTTDRSGRTLKDYREIYWAEKAKRQELEAERDENIPNLLDRIEELETELQHNISERDNQAAHITELQAKLDAMEKLINEQAEDDGLWFNAATAPEAYLQKELRRLHAIGEREEQSDE